MSASQHPRMTAEVFVEWAMRQPEGVRHELVGGQAVLMAPERSAHALAKFRIARRLAEAVKQSGLPCTVYADGMAVDIDDDTVYEPDAQLRCGPPVPGETTLLDDPMIVVEVRSRSTGSRDTAVEFMDYLRLPSLRHCLIVDLDARTIIHHARDEAGRIATRIVRNGPVVLDPPGIVPDGVWPGPEEPGGSTPP